jgi:hypothetical protein
MKLLRVFPTQPRLRDASKGATDWVDFGSINYARRDDSSIVHACADQEAMTRGVSTETKLNINY